MAKPGYLNDPRCLRGILTRPLTKAAMACLAIAFALPGCSTVQLPTPETPTSSRLQRLLPADAILLGEQHDNRDHQRIQYEVVVALAARGELAALVLEMAPQGHTTLGWRSDYSQAADTQDPSRPKEPTNSKHLSVPDVRSALNWDDRAWPWAVYQPAIMAAVRAGVPVMGANLPRSQMREAMQEASLDTRLGAAALQAQQQLIRSGHCSLLPETQIAPMTRIQIARDKAMAQTLASAVLPGKTVLLLAGSGHVDKHLGVPQHLPNTLVAKAVQLGPDATAQSNSFDLVWPSLPTPPKDYCAELKSTLQKQ